MSGLGRLLVLAIRGYQRWISPAMGQHCRFAPTCSSYAAEAISVHGPLRGGWLALRRLARCHPWNPGGPDPVPGAGGDPVPGAGGDPVPGAGGDPVPGAGGDPVPPAERAIDDDGQVSAA